MIYPNRLTAYVMNDLVENLNPYIENEKQDLKRMYGMIFLNL